VPKRKDVHQDKTRDALPYSSDKDLLDRGFFVKEEGIEGHSVYADGDSPACLSQPGFSPDAGDL